MTMDPATTAAAFRGFIMFLPRGDDLSPATDCPTSVPSNGNSEVRGFEEPTRMKGCGVFI
jgi:hypothetical protein